MPRRSGPSVRSRRLLYELRKLKSAAGLTGDALASAVGFTASKISRIESGDTGIYPSDLEILLDFYRVSKTKRAELLDIARHAEQRNWLRMNNPNLPRDWQVWTDFEAEASGFLIYHPLMLPGLLQTPEYARAIISATGRELSDEQVESLVGNRMARQSLLTRKKPVELNVIIQEHVLDLPFDPPRARERQLRHLIESMAMPNVTIRIMPTAAGLHGGLNGPFVILQYDVEASLVLLENKQSSLFLDEIEHIETYEAVWGELSALAYDEDESMKFLRDKATALAS